MKRLTLFISMILGIALSSFTLKPTKPLPHRAGHVEDLKSKVVGFTNNKVNYTVLMLNNNGPVVNTANQRVDFHLAVIPVGDKFIGFAYDIVKAEDHEKADQYVKEFAIAQGLEKLLMQEYSVELLKQAAEYCHNDKTLAPTEQEKILQLIRQDIEYISTDYFKTIYMDGDRMRTEREVCDWISKNIIPQAENALGELSAKTATFKGQ